MGLEKSRFRTLELKELNQLDSRPFGRLRAFWIAENGAATIEAVLWMPVFIFLFALLADTALVFGGQARVLRVVQDTNRAISIGRIRNSDDAEAAILAQIAPLSPNATAVTAVQNGVIISSVVIPLTDLTATSIVAAFDTVNLTVTAQHMAEN